MKSKTVEVWFAVNKNGFVGMYNEQPVRNEETGKWESKFPFVNSLAYDQIVALVEKAQMNWNNNPECITLQFQ